MPGRKTHIYYALRMITDLNLSVDREAVSIIQTLIDYPSKLPRVYLEKLREKCSSQLLEAYYSGLRGKGYFVHDWRSEGGRDLLKEIVSCVFGNDAVLLVDLHFLLDDIWEGKQPRGYDHRVLHYASRLLDIRNY